MSRSNIPPVFGPLGEGWDEALEPVSEQLTELAQFLDAQKSAGEVTLPQLDQVMRAFKLPFAEVRVLIVGQDPYPTPGHATGLAFSVARKVRPIPRSLQNIFTELHHDLGIDRPTHGDLSTWADQGVLLLNRCLTVDSGQPGSHRGRGWEKVTAQAISALAVRGGPLVALLWGKDAQSLRPLLGEVPTIESAHPSPLSASRGFFGSSPFSRANDALAQQSAEPIDWGLAG